jgi:hypothetical protein
MRVFAGHQVFCILYAAFFVDGKVALHMLSSDAIDPGGAT